MQLYLYFVFHIDLKPDNVVDFSGIISESNEEKEAGKEIEKKEKKIEKAIKASMKQRQKKRLIVGTSF